MRALRELARQFPDSAIVFATERGGTFTADAVNWLIKCIGARPLRFTPACCGRASATPWPTRPRHAARPGLVGPQGHRARDALHAIERGAVQRLLEVTRGAVMYGAAFASSFYTVSRVCIDVR